jgi:ketoreductase RED2
MPAQPVAVVTGSTSGIGEAVARRFAEAGTRVVINSARSVEAGEKLAAELPGAIYVQADIADPDQAAELIRVAVDSFGRIDVLVNNAGVTRSIPHADLAAVTPQVWWDILGVNVVGTWQVTVAAMAHLKAAGGCVVNVSSIAGIRPAGSSIPYAVS